MLRMPVLESRSTSIETGAQRILQEQDAEHERCPSAVSKYSKRQKRMMSVNFELKRFDLHGPWVPV